MNNMFRLSGIMMFMRYVTSRLDGFFSFLQDRFLNLVNSRHFNYFNVGDAKMENYKSTLTSEVFLVIFQSGFHGGENGVYVLL